MAVSKFSDPNKKKMAVRKTYRFPKFWSYSRFDVFNKCAARYEYQHLQKLPQPPSIHLDRGNKVHKEGEDYLDGTLKRMPASYKAFAGEMRAIKKLEAVAEGSYAFTKSWNPCSPTDWDNAWLRVKIDASVKTGSELTQIDFKTGKCYPAATVQQSELYAVAGFLLDDEIETIETEFWYLDSGEVVKYVYGRAEFKKLKAKWAARGRDVVAARQFPPTTNAYNCTYCPFSSKATLGNGDKGPCEAWKKAK